MARKSAGEAVSIVGVSTFDNARAHAAEQREATTLAYAITCGSVYAHGLAYPVPGVLPAGEAAITALAVGAEGKVFGVTSGRRAHLFWMPRPLLIAAIGAIDGVSQAAEGLVLGPDGFLYGAARDGGGPLFRHSLATDFVGLYRTRSAPIEMLRAPFKDDGVVSLSLSEDQTTIAGLGERTGRPFLYSLKTGRVKALPRPGPENEAMGRVLCPAGNGFYGSGADGQLFHLSVEGDVEWLDAALPSRRGKAYLARAHAFLRARSGRIYGGTEDGYLFSFDPLARRLVSHGRPCDIPDLHALAEGSDGSIYGLVGREKDVTHLVRFRPAAAEWTDLGMFQSYGHYPWLGYQVRALVAGQDGQLYAGEHDRFGHLFIYHPGAAPELCQSNP